MTKHNTNPSPTPIQKWVIVLIMIVVAVVSLYYAMDHYSDGGCDGGLCGLLLIVHAAPLLAAWIFTLLSFAIVKIARIASMALLVVGGLINAVLLFIDYGTHLEELKVPVFILFVAQAYVFFQWQSLVPTHQESGSEKASD